MQRIVAILLMLISCSLTWAGPVGFKFSHITSQQGLPYQQVMDLVEDNDGYIWIATRCGLSRYDGYTLRNYYHDDNDAKSLSSNFVHYLFKDSHGRI